MMQMNEQNLYRQRHLYREANSVADDTTPCVCSFCGATLDEDERFCPDCGNPRTGIACPSCGTMSRRSFCSRCNTPLNELAREAVRMAKNDPLFQQAERLAAELLELEQQINGAEESGGVVDTSLNEEARAVAARYAQLFGSTPVVPAQAAHEPKAAAPKPAMSGDILKKAIEAYRAKAEELQRTIDAMMPPANATPEQQRNFFCARKITVLAKKARQNWVCNLCGCYHNQPSECAQPELGGKWVITTETTKIDGTIYS